MLFLDTFTSLSYRSSSTASSFWCSSLHRAYRRRITPRPFNKGAPGKIWIQFISVRKQHTSLLMQLLVHENNVHAQHLYSKIALEVMCGASPQCYFIDASALACTYLKVLHRQARQLKRRDSLPQSRFSHQLLLLLFLLKHHSCRIQHLGLCYRGSKNGAITDANHCWYELLNEQFCRFY